MSSRLIALFAPAYGDPVDEPGIEQRLREAAERGELSVVQRLLPVDAEASAARVAKYGLDLLLVAVSHEKQTLIDYVISLDASMVATHRQTLLRSAIRYSNIELVDCVAKIGLPSVCREGGEPVVILAVRQKFADDETERIAKTQGGFFSRLASPWEQGSGPSKSMKAEGVIACLLRHSADVNAVGLAGDTALHIASREALGTSVVVLLLRYGATASLEAKNGEGLSPLHEAVKARHAAVVKVLLTAGADPAVTTTSGETPLQLAIFPDFIREIDVYELTRTLVMYGRANWDSGCDACLASLSDTESNQSFTRWERQALRRFGNRREFAEAIRECVIQWNQDGLYGMPCTNVPIEVLRLGKSATLTYTKTMKTSHVDDVVHRRKVCVVGPSEWGKTSLVRSVVSNTPSLVHADDGRTIGIDLMGYAFVDKNRQGTTNYEVTFWDFAGQDIYQVTHTLFFSKRTLYLVCVDLKAYADAMKEAQAQSTSRNREAVIQRFVSRNILYWIRLIFVRQPDAEFVIVGTKYDCISHLSQEEEVSSAVKRIWADLRMRVNRWKRNLYAEIDEAIRNATDSSPSECPPIGLTFCRPGNLNDKTRLEDIKSRVEMLLSGEWIVVSAATSEAVFDARRSLERAIARCACGFAMPTVYSEVLKTIHMRRDEAATLDPTQRVESMIVSSQELSEALVQEVEGLSIDTCEPILRTLHELGDILWYEQEATGILQDCVLLDPTIVLDLVREVVNHDHIRENKKRGRNGVVTQSDLLSLPLWKQLDAELMFAFKSLLQYFQLAYPADNQPMDWDSDLIVPAYWKTNKQVNLSDRGKTQDRVKLVVCWEYELASTMSEIIFENVAVLSHTPFAQRRLEHRRFEADDDSAYVTVIVSLVHAETLNRDVLRIEAGSTAGDSLAAWNWARFYVMTVEHVLEGFPGLTTSRYLVAVQAAETERRRHRVNDVVKTYKDATLMGKRDDAIRTLLPWLPSGDLAWFAEKAWRRPSILREMRVREIVDSTSRKMDVLRKLVAAEKSQRLYPALWTLEHDGNVVLVRMLSDVSGLCFHEPIDIQVPSSFWVQHGPKIHHGLSILSTVIPDAISIGIISKVARLAVSTVDAKVERAIQVHNAIDHFDVPALNRGNTKSGAKWSAQGAAVLLRRLLELHDPEFNDLKIPQMSNLRCATTTDGSFVWAHADEIVALSEELTPCNHVGDFVQLVDDTRTGPATEMNDRFSASLTTVCDESTTAQLQLYISEIDGLARWDWRKLYCKWEIIRTSIPDMPVCSGVTPRQPSNTDKWAWGSLAFPLTKVTSVDFLRECRLVVEVERPSRYRGAVKSLGRGSVSLAELSTTDPNESKSLTVRVPFDEKKAQAKTIQPPCWVSCQITITPPAQSA